jgi:hypothetical protein
MRIVKDSMTYIDIDSDGYNTYEMSIQFLVVFRNNYNAQLIGT